jgi:transcriptional regulator with XRE-family HTH domain
VGVSESTVHRWCKPKRRGPDLGQAFSAARALGVSLEWLADESVETEAEWRRREERSEMERMLLESAYEVGLKESIRILNRAGGDGGGGGLYNRISDAPSNPEAKQDAARDAAREGEEKKKRKPL